MCVYIYTHTHILHKYNKTYNVTLRHIHETIVAVKSNNNYVIFCVRGRGNVLARMLPY